MRVIDVKPDAVVLDGNHPLAGETLRYSVVVRDVRPATEEEIEEAAAAVGAMRRRPRRNLQVVEHPVGLGDTCAVADAVGTQAVGGNARGATGEAFELEYIVRAEDVDVDRVLAAQFAQAFLVAQACGAVLLHHPLVETQAGRAVRAHHVHFRVIEVRVAGVEFPAALAAHRHADMAVRVALQRHKQKIGRQAFEVAHAVEAHPRLARRAGIRMPLLMRGPLLRPEALAVQPGALLLGVLALGGHHVHARVGEIVQPAGMVEIEVGHHDVANVARVEAHALDLADRGHLLAEIRCDQAEEEAREPAVRIANVAQAHAGVDEDESVRRLHQQAVRGEVAAFHHRRREPVHQPPAERAGGDAVEVVDLHGRGRRGVALESPRRAVAAS